MQRSWCDPIAPCTRRRNSQAVQSEYRSMPARTTLRYTCWKASCRPICSAFFHGTEVASERVDVETYAAFNRAVREAVRRINANKRAYMRYFIDYHKAKDPEIGTLAVEDLREG